MFLYVLDGKLLQSACTVQVSGGNTKSALVTLPIPTRKLFHGESQRRHGVRPAPLLPSQAADQLLSVGKLHDAPCRFRFQLLRTR